MSTEAIEQKRCILSSIRIFLSPNFIILQTYNNKRMKLKIN